MGRRTTGTKGIRWFFDSESRRENGRVVLTLRGRISYAVAGQLARALAEALGQEPVDLVVDFSGVDYISGAGAAPMVSTAAQLGAKGRTVFLCGLQDPVR